MSFVQGDNGYTRPFVIPKYEVKNLEGAAVKVAIKRGEELINKVATIVDVASGKCEFTLTSSDLTIIGPYKYQWTVEFEDGKTKSGRAGEFYVSEKLAGVPPSIGPITVSVDGGEF
jgi:flagellar basal body rod protein FlgG